MEVDVQPGEAALLRGAGQAQQAAFGALPRLQVQASTQAHLHRGRTPAESGRVQGHDEESAAGAESHLHTQVQAKPVTQFSGLSSPPSFFAEHLNHTQQ